MRRIAVENAAAAVQPERPSQAPPSHAGCAAPAWVCRDGDVYIGGRWNELSVLYLIFLVVPLLGLLFAWATHGTLWDTGVYY